MPRCQAGPPPPISSRIMVFLVFLVIFNGFWYPQGWHSWFFWFFWLFSMVFGSLALEAPGPGHILCSASLPPPSPPELWFFGFFFVIFNGFWYPQGWHSWFFLFFWLFSMVFGSLALEALGQGPGVVSCELRPIPTACRYTFVAENAIPNLYLGAKIAPVRHTPMHVCICATHTYVSGCVHRKCLHLCMCACVHGYEHRKRGYGQRPFPCSTGQQSWV